jgi:mycothiol synthase
MPAIVEIVQRRERGRPHPVADDASASRLAEYRHASPSFDAHRDVTVAEVDGRPVAVATREWVDTSDGELREYRVGGDVHPDWRRRGIGRALLADNEERRASWRRPTDRSPQGLRPPSPASTRRAPSRCSSGAAIAPVRWFFDMIRPTSTTSPTCRCPTAWRSEPITPDQYYRRVWEADHEAFRDHWGGFDDSPAGVPALPRQSRVRPQPVGHRLRRRRDRGRRAQRHLPRGERGPRRRARLARQRLHPPAVARRGLARALIARSLVALASGA